MSEWFITINDGQHLERINRLILIKIGMEYLEEYDIKTNNTKLAVGRVLELSVPDSIMLPDGSLDPSKAGSVIISDLNVYHAARRITEFEYARP